MCRSEKSRLESCWGESRGGVGCIGETAGGRSRTSSAALLMARKDSSRDAVTRRGEAHLLGAMNVLFVGGNLGLSRALRTPRRPGRSMTKAKGPDACTSYLLTPHPAP